MLHIDTSTRTQIDLSRLPRRCVELTWVLSRLHSRGPSPWLCPLSLLHAFCNSSLSSSSARMPHHGVEMRRRRTNACLSRYYGKRSLRRYDQHPRSANRVEQSHGSQASDKWVSACNVRKYLGFVECPFSGAAIAEVVSWFCRASVELPLLYILVLPQIQPTLTRSP